MLPSVSGGEHRTRGATRDCGRYRQHHRGRRQGRGAGGHIQSDRVDRLCDTLAHNARHGFHADRLRSLRLMEGFYVGDSLLYRLSLIQLERQLRLRELETRHF